MNRKTIEKLNLFLSGLRSRYEESGDFFVRAEAEFKTGGKLVQAVFEERLYYNKEFYEVSFEKALEILVAEASKYDALNFRYKERGTTITVAADERNVTIRQEAADNKPTLTGAGHRSSFVKPSQAQELLREIGILTGDGKIKNDMIRKYNQIDHFVEVVDPLLKELLRKDSITILDCACGKSYLSFVLNFYIVEVLKKKCRIIGVDHNQQVIDASRERAKRLGYKNMTFVREDLIAYEPDQPIDLLVSLHACDNATDYAIAAGVRLNAQAMIVVPCCHKELLEQLAHEELEPLLKHSIFKVRFNDMFTDALRALYLESKGYEVSALEYVSPLDTPKNILLRAIKKLSHNAKAEAEYRRIKKQFHIDPIIDKL